jgi:hypothetical protein
MKPRAIAPREWRELTALLRDPEVCRRRRVLVVLVTQLPNYYFIWKRPPLAVRKVWRSRLFKQMAVLAGDAKPAIPRMQDHHGPRVIFHNGCIYSIKMLWSQPLKCCFNSMPERCVMSTQSSPAASLRTINRFPAAGMLLRVASYLIYKALSPILPAISGAGSSFLPAFPARQGNPGTRVSVAVFPSAAWNGASCRPVRRGGGGEGAAASIR